MSNVFSIALALKLLPKELAWRKKGASPQHHAHHNITQPSFNISDTQSDVPQSERSQLTINSKDKDKDKRPPISLSNNAGIPSGTHPPPFNIHSTAISPQVKHRHVPIGLGLPGKNSNVQHPPPELSDGKRRRSDGSQSSDAAPATSPTRPRRKSFFKFNSVLCISTLTLSRQPTQTWPPRRSLHLPITPPSFPPGG